MGTIKSNKKKEKPNPVGRPLKYKTAKEMQAVIDEYFNACYQQKHDTEYVGKGEKKRKILVPQFYVNGDPIMEYVQPITISGLARRLDMTREQLIEYSERNEFTDTVKKAKARVQEYVEYALMAGKAHPSSAIFNLKNNYGWKDKTESEVTNTHLHLHGVAKASYQEADKLDNQEYRELLE